MEAAVRGPRCVTGTEPYCPVLKEAHILMRCSIPPELRAECLHNTEKELKIVPKSLDISVKRAGKNQFHARVSVRSTGEASPACFGRYPREEGGCSECPRLEDCMFEQHLANIRGMQISAEVRVVQARLQV